MNKLIFSYIVFQVFFNLSVRNIYLKCVRCLFAFINSIKGSYYIARPNYNQSTISKLSTQWSKKKPYCMQFWYSVHAKSDSSMEICGGKKNSTTCLWSMPSSTTEKWKFGQVEIPENFEGNVSSNMTQIFLSFSKVSISVASWPQHLEKA